MQSSLHSTLNLVWSTQILRLNLAWFELLFSLVNINFGILEYLNSIYPSLWPSGIGTHLGRNRLRVQVLAVSDTYRLFIELTIAWVPGYI